MKKTLAILLISIQLYNVGGYMALFQYVIYRADQLNELQISKDHYQKSDLVEVKIPVHLPVVGDWAGYQSISGSVQLAQNCYNYVGMKITQDTLFVMCIPNSKSTRLNKANVIFAREVSEAPFNSKKQNLPANHITWFKFNPSVIILANTPLALTAKPTIARLRTEIITNHPDVTTPPPEYFPA